MRSRTPALSLVLALVASTLGVACAAQEDEVEDQGGAVSGGSDKSDSPIVFFFGSPDDELPACVGTKLSDTIVVTAAECANKDFLVRRARAKDGPSKNVAIKAVHVPADADAEIAVVELASGLKGPNARVRAMGLHDGYTIGGAATLDTDEKNASLVEGTIESQTATSGFIVPKDGQQLCDTDLGASVFSKMPKRKWYTAWIFPTGKWELSGVLTGPTASAPAAPAETQPSAPEPEQPSAPKADSSSGPALETSGDLRAQCSNVAWRVAPLALHEDFLKTYAPEAFPAPKTASPSGSTTSSASAAVKTCALVTDTLPDVKTGERTTIIRAKATFANASDGQSVGQFGIAPKSSPTSMTWTPANMVSSAGSSTVDSQFEGGINAPSAEGEYIVAFRVSADGGISWTECDLDGSENGFSVANAIELKVAASAPSTSNPAPPQDYTAPTSSSSSDDDEPSYSSSSRGDDEDEDDITAPRKKKSSDSGCSVSHSRGGTSSGLPALGILLGLAAITRRRLTSSRR